MKLTEKLNLKTVAALDLQTVHDWRDHAEALEAVVLIARDSDFGLDHAYWCETSHGKGAPCDCGLDKALARLREMEQSDEPN